MKRLMIAALIVLSLTGCGRLDRIEATWTGYSTQCINGVTYIQFTSGATVMVDQNGKPVKC